MLKTKQVQKNVRYILAAVGYALIAVALWTLTLVLANAGDTWLRRYLPVTCSAIICTVTIVGGTVLLRRKTQKTETVFLFLFLLVGVGMLICMPMWRVPDEQAHMRRVWLIASGQWFSSTGEYRMPGNFSIEQIDSITMNHRAIADAWGIKLSEQLMPIPVGVLEATAVYPIVDYFPQALFMRIAMLFTDARFPLLYAARLGSLTTCAFLFWLSIRIIPKGKNVIIGVAMCPITLQEVSSGSADGLTIALATLFVAYVVRLTVERPAFKWRQTVCLGALSVAIALFKVFYLPLIALLFLIPFDTKNQRWSSLLICFGAAGLSILLWFVLQILPTMAQGSRTGGYLPALLVAIQHPMQMIVAITRTILNSAIRWVEEMTGISLGWFNLSMSSGVCLCYIAAALWLMVQDEPIPAGNGGLRLMMFALSVFSALAIIVSLLGWWNDIGVTFISGIQGRYFLPLVLPVCLAVKKNGFEKNEAALTRGYILVGMIDLVCLLLILMQTL